MLYAAAEQSDGDFPPRQVGSYALIATDVRRRESDQVVESERYTYRGGSASSVELSRYHRELPSPDLIQLPRECDRVLWPPSARCPRAERPPLILPGPECEWLGQTPAVDVDVTSAGRTERGRAGSWYTRCGTITTATFEVGAAHVWYTLVVRSERQPPNLTEIVSLATRLLDPVCAGCRFDTP